MIRFDERQKTITLHTQRSSYQMKLDGTGVLLHTYYGPRLRGGDISYLIQTEDRGFSPNPDEAGTDRTYSLDTLPQEYSSSGVGDFRIPSLEADCADGSHTVDLRYVRHTIRDGKYALEGLPAFYDGEGVQAQTLEVTLLDRCSGLEVTLLYGVLEEYDLITRAVRIRNGGPSALRLDRVASVCLDFPAGTPDLITMGGAYGREREPVRMPLTQGVHTVGSIRGTSSHQQNPFMVLCGHDTTEDAGCCWGLALVYSGNFQASAEYTQFHETRLTMGIHPFHFSWTLEPGQQFTAPEAAMIFSDRGLGQMSRQFHRAIRSHLCRGPWKESRRPILINNWEATLFHFDADKIVSIAEAASKVGLEMMVMDDGWFGKRDSDFSGLGDWNVNEKKLPGGLAPLARRINDLGMKFGLWVEPEMISEDSDLYRAHPDWAFRVPGRPVTRGRFQLVLDLTRKEVREYVTRNLRATLKSANIEYVKWDMNRSLTDVWSCKLPANRQGELYHRFVLAVYEILETIHREFPNLLIEGCSGGGGRFDCGMLYYTPQIWCSDNTDAIDRLRIQYGTSFCYPCSAVGAHVSAVPNCLTNRSTPMHTRGVVAAAGTFGYELDLNEISGEELEEVRRQIDHFKRCWDVVMKGDYYRLSDPFSDAPFQAWMHVSPEGDRALVGVVMGTVHANPIRPRLCLKGLDPAADYRINGEIYGGDQLMYAGLPLPILNEYEAVQYDIVKV
ncbi:alpha-galactosidase [Pseudoflavonifractor phocaeensis]|uniref:alpha-galactosidase n=1 Tax=Pseudoflavonifractor phocaeensis TaxID=1870988 RepID=UPI00195E417A|nr:alpha-galactosidase [Pseudoflavonifractor phocaeensis]MBM6870956.1 alpha-galactosidase [Pseudoflavonifractor phocaeensis]MBM6938311.1 alpha-galactosidase [Pseudoflavonifractor phocaeensis]